MRMDLYTKILFTVIAGCLVILAVATFRARPAFGFKVTSLRRNVSRSGTYVVKLWNSSKTAQSYSVSTGIWHRDGWGKNFYEADENTRSCEGWIELPLREFSLSPDEWKEIPFRIKIPRGLKVTHVAMIWITTEPRGKGQIKVRQRIGVKVYANPRRVRKLGEIASMTYEGGYLFLAFLNKGNVELKLEGYVQSGEVKVELPLAYVLPERLRLLKVEIPYSPEIEAVIDYGGKNLAGGRLCE